MTTLAELMMRNAAAAILLALVALAVGRFIPWAALRHAAWLVVLVRLVMPPIVSIDIPLPEVGWPESKNVLATTLPASPWTGTAPHPGGRAEPEVRPGSFAGREGPIDPSLTRTLGAIPGSALGVPVESGGALPWRPVLLTLVLGVGAFLLGLAVLRLGELRRRLRTAPDASPELIQRASELAGELGLKRTPRILVTDEPVSPMLLPGILPVIVLPSGLLDRLAPDERDALVAHELAHVRRGDAWVRPLELIVTALYWWFPLLWYARRRLRDAEEAACDALVLRVLPHARRAYAEGLLKTVEFVTEPGRPPILATGAADSRNLKERVVSILKPSNLGPIPRPVWGIALAVSLLSMSLAPAWTRDEAERRSAERLVDRAARLAGVVSVPTVDFFEPSELMELVELQELALPRNIAPVPSIAPVPRIASVPRVVAVPRVAPIAREPVNRLLSVNRSLRGQGRALALAPGGLARRVSSGTMTVGHEDLIEAEFELRRQVIAMEAQLVQLHLNLRDVEVAREIEQAERAERRAKGTGEIDEAHAARLRYELEQLERRADMERELHRREAELRADTLHLELRAQELHLRCDLARQEEDLDALEGYERDLLEAQANREAMDIRHLEYEIERQQAELELHRGELQAQHDRLRERVERRATERAASKSDDD